MIFISYSWKDQLAVKRVEKVLANIGAKYWIDRENLDLDGCIRSQINHALQQADYVLCIVTEASRLSGWVCYEKRIASKLGKKIIEFDLGGSNLKPNNMIHKEKLLAALPVVR